MRWFIYLFLFFAPFCLRGQTPTLDYFKAHPEECPKSVTLKSPTEFTLFLNGKEMGKMAVPAETRVEFVRVADSGIEVSVREGQRAIISLDQSDFVELWRGIHAEKSGKASSDPVILLQLPPCSVTLDWYKKRLDEQINPWLAKNTEHELAPQIKALKESFEKESERVKKGEVRIGDHWISTGDMDEWEEDLKARTFFMEYIKLQNKPDAGTFVELLQKMPDLSRAELYPSIIRVVNEIASGLQGSFPSEKELKSKHEPQIKELEQKIETLTTELKEALKHVVVGHEKPRGGDSQHASPDGLYRPPSRYIFAYHYMELEPYYPDPKGYYLDYPPKQYEEYKKKALTIAEYKQQIKSLEESVEQAGKKVQEQKEMLDQVSDKFPIKVADKGDSILDAIKKSKKVPFDQALALLESANKEWPQNAPAIRACCDKAEGMIAECESLIEQRKFEEAKYIQNSVYKILTISQTPSKRRDILYEKCYYLRSKISQEERKKRSA